MATMFLDDGSASGSLPVGTGAVVYVTRGNTPELEARGYVTFDRALLESIGPRKFWKTSGAADARTLVAMTAEEQALVQARLDADAAEAAAEAGRVAKRRTRARETINVFEAYVEDDTTLTTKQFLGHAAKAIVFLLKESFRG